MNKIDSEIISKNDNNASKLLFNNDDLITALKTVYDPEIPVDIYELGLIYNVDIIDNKTVEIKMTLTAPGCPVAEEMPGCHRAPHKNSHRVSSPSLSFPLPRSVYCQNSPRFERYCTVYGCSRTARSL